MFRIRQAGIADLPAATRMLAKAWRESYAGVVPDAVLDAREAGSGRQAERWALSASQGTYFWIVVDDSGEIVGVASALPARDDDPPAALELAMIYLLDVAKGSGIADRLLQVCVGDAPAYLWVLEENPRARSFYRKHGFEPNGRRQVLAMGDTDVPEIMLVRGDARV